MRTCLPAPLSGTIGEKQDRSERSGPIVRRRNGLLCHAANPGEVGLAACEEGDGVHVKEIL